MAILVFANGELPDVEWVRPYLAQAATVVAADGGTRHLLALDRPPDVLIGDLDSLPVDARAWINAAQTRVIPHSADKDETDLELALLYAAENYDGEIWLFGVLGGRLDQTLANVFLLAHPSLQHRSVKIINQHERAWLVTRSAEIHGAAGDLVSLIPLGGDVLVRHTSGLRWSLEAETLPVGPARGVSNVMTAALATVTLGSGRLLCIHTRRSWQR